MLCAATGTASASTALDTIDDARVGPLVKSKWDQKYAGGNISNGDRCYNYHTTNACPCGCGPTCFAQIMRYHEWPKTAVDTNSFVTAYDGLTKTVSTTNAFPCSYNEKYVVKPMKMIGGVYDWSKMPYETQTSGTPDDEREMIGRLCYDVGVSMSAFFGDTMTGVGSPVAVHALPGNFHYADAAAVE